MSTINNFGELKTAITDWTLASSDVAAEADLIVRLAQPYISLKLRHREMLTIEELTVASGAVTVPEWFAAPRRIVYFSGTTRVVLKPMTIERADELYPTRPSGIPVHFVISDKIRLFPVPEDGDEIELTYYKQLVPFSADEDTDWLLTKYPNVYLAAGQMYAASWIEEDSEAQKHALICDTFINMLNAMDDQSGLGIGEYNAELGIP